MRDHENIDPYAVLQVHPTAEPEIVDAAYRRLARTYHPDVNKAPGAHETMVRINLAYEILGDPAKRAAYDLDRANRQQTEWQAWTERAERERRERQARAEQERRAQAERKRQARANAERQRAEREQRERQAQAEPIHQSYAEWEADMQRRVRANAERQRDESERQARAKQEASAQSQQDERSDAEQRLPIRATIIGGAYLGAILGGALALFNSAVWLALWPHNQEFWRDADALLFNSAVWPTLWPSYIFGALVEFGNFVAFLIIVGMGALNLLLSSYGVLSPSIMGPFGIPSRRFWTPHPQGRIRFVRAAVATTFALLSILGILVGLLGNNVIIVVVSSFIHGATGGIANGLYGRYFPQFYKEHVSNGNWWRV